MLQYKYLSLLLISILVGCQPTPSTTQEINQATIKKTNQTADTPHKAIAKKQDPIVEQTYSFAWLKEYSAKNMLVNRISVPENYTRTYAAPTSFADWLRNLPLKEGNPPIKLYNQTNKDFQDNHHAVFNIDVGKEDLQQCADAIMRLRAEFFFNTDQKSNIHFNFTNGTKVDYSKWMNGYRPVISGNKVKFVKSKQKSSTYFSFRQYMKKIFMYAGTFSLAKELQPIQDIKDIAVGDIFIQGGFPGHAILVVDVAQHNTSGEKIFLLAQSYMPAQDIHLLKNPNDLNLSPWYSTNFDGQLITPDWTFNKKDLKRFAD